MKPFSTPVLSKRTYRELKLLKHIQHENVDTLLPSFALCQFPLFLDYQPQRRFHLTFGGYVCIYSLPSLLSVLTAFLDSYFVTELLGTDLHRLLTSRPLEKQFIQYFLYQILVSPASLSIPASSSSLPLSVGSNTCIRRASSTAIL